MGVSTDLHDVDALRSLLRTGFSRAERDLHIRRVGFLASRLEYHGVTVICALISPYAESRAWVREHCQRFVEIHVSTPIGDCERRDVKGLYAAARRGEITSFTGVDDPYEPPVAPELTIDTSIVPLSVAVERVLSAWPRVASLEARRVG